MSEGKKTELTVKAFCWVDNCSTVTICSYLPACTEFFSTRELARVCRAQQNCREQYLTQQDTVMATDLKTWPFQVLSIRCSSDVCTDNTENMHIYFPNAICVILRDHNY
jgi:hypothetical protein